MSLKELASENFWYNPIIFWFHLYVFTAFPPTSRIKQSEDRSLGQNNGMVTKRSSAPFQNAAYILGAPDLPTLSLVL